MNTPTETPTQANNTANLSSTNTANTANTLGATAQPVTHNFEPSYQPNYTAQPVRPFPQASSLEGTALSTSYGSFGSSNSAQENYDSYPDLPKIGKIKTFSSQFAHPTKATLWSAVATILTIGLMSTVMLSISLTKQNQIAKQLAATPLYPNTSIPLTNVGNTNNLSLGQLSQIDLNGRVVVNGSLVLSPQETPSNAANGELYYDQTTGNVAYYNGNEFKALVTSNQTVASIGGLQGSVALGDGLTTVSGRLTLTNPISSAQANTPIPTSYVASIQNQTGAIALMPGTGIAITSTTTGTGLSSTTNLNITNTGVTSVANLTGAILTGRGIIATGNVISSNITLTSGSGDLAVTDDGNGNYTIASTGVGQGGTVALGPGTPQADNTTNPSISINKTNTGNLIDLKVTNASKFVVDNTGTITSGSIAYTQVTGRPTSTVETLGGASGTITIGSGLTLVGNVLSSTTSGITTINGTADQVTANTVAGITTLSLPQSIATSSSPTFANLNLSTALSVANGGTGATTASQARTNLSAAASGSNSDITSLTALTNITPIASLTIGSTTQNLTLQGTTTTLTSTNGSFTSTLSFATPTANNSIIVPNQSGTICLSTGNCLGGASGGATTSLNNLANVAINTSLLPGSTTIDLGSTANPFRDAYIGSTPTNNFRLTGSSTAARTITFPDATGTVCLTTGNCAGAGGGITGSGSSNTIAMFTGSGTIGNSMLTQNAGATTLTISGDLSVNSGTGSITGNGANITALNASNITTGVLGTSRGGTNLNTTPTNGQLLIGNGTGYTLATLTEGSNITITNTPGGIAIGAIMPAVGANTSLSNLASVAINTSLLPGTSGINLGSATQPFGSIYLGSGSNNVVLSATTTAGRTITLPDADGTICLQASTACGYAASSGSSNYIQNQYASQQPTSSLWISGIARSDVSVLTPTLDTTTATALGIGTTNATAINLGRAATTTTIAGTLLATGNNITLGTVGSSQITNNGSTLNATLALGNYPTGGSIGTAADTVNIYTSFTINQTTANQTLTIPSPTNTVAGRVIYISNIGSATFNISGVPINASSSATFVWSGSTWNIVGSSTGVTAVGILDSQAKSVNGASIVGNTIYFQSADATNPGMVNTSNQTFAGAKTFTSLLTGTAGANIGGAAVNLNVSSNNATNINTGTSTGAVTIGGSSLVAKNTANTTAAFQVQNAAGTGILNVDTTNATVNVGTAATYLNYTVGAGFAAKIDYATGSSPRGIVGSDVNADSKPDMLVVNYSSNTVSVFLNNGNGTFAAKVDYTTGTNPEEISAADVNGDSKPDILVANNGSSTVSVLINSGNGTFVAKVDYAVNGTPRSITTADVNGDSKPDILSANSSTNTTSVLINNGNGTFATKVDYTVGTSPKSVTTADVNGDSWLDILVANNGSITVSVLTNNGNGTFAAKVDYATSTSTFYIAAADLNSDGKPDIATVGFSTPSYVSVLINNGNGTFAAKVDYLVNATGNAYAVSINDLNADGKPDIVTSSTTIGASVFINTGNGAFAAKVDYATGSGPYAITTADVNGDAKPDIMTANNTANTVSVIMNSSTIIAVKSNLSTTVANINQAGYILQAAAGQTADLFRVQDSTGTNTLFNIGAAGNVGIGNTATIHKLDVNGTTNVRGDLYVGGIKRIDSLGNLYNINNYTPVGNVLFQNQLNSTTSFQVQNATANNMLAIDTTNKKITVGTAGTSQFINNASTLNTALALANYASGGSIGTAAATVDIYTTFTIPQTTANQTLTIPSPTTTTAGRIIYIINTGTASFTIGTYTIGAGTTATYIWNGTAWIASQAGAPGVTQIGALDGQAKNANGATISGSSLYLQTADATNPGLLSTTTQTIAGAKTFTSLLTGTAGATITGSTISLNVSSNNNTNINTGTSTGIVTIGGNSVLFKNTTNSTSAMVIQNSTGTPLFTADTTNMKVTITNLVVTGNLTINGHIVTTGTTPTIAAGAAACTTPTVSVAGNDTTGIISITTGTGCAATGVMGTVTFASAFASAPRISITPTNTNAANLKYFSGASGTTTFTLDTGTVATNSTAYTFSYIVTQ